MNIGLVGCGAICKAYLSNAERLGLKFVAAADLVMERAQATAKEYNIPKALTTEQLLADPDVQVVLNLTIPEAHFPVSKAALEAGKHIYSEKPLAVTRDQGAQLRSIAKSKKLRIGCAPDTFLGAGFQTARQLLDEGAIGEPVGVEVLFHGRGPDDPTHFLYRPGGGILMDMGPYYLTGLVTLLGAVGRLAGSAKTIPTEAMIKKNPEAAKKVAVPTTVTGVLEMTSGIAANFNVSYNVCEWYHIHFKIRGSDATLVLPDPNSFGGDVVVMHFNDEKKRVKTAGPMSENSRGIGLSDMINGIKTNTPHKANEDVSFHVLDIMNSLVESSETGKYLKLGSTMTRPEPLKEAQQG